MKDSKKKTMVLVLLGVVCLGVGAFQFMSMSAPAPKPEATAKKSDNASQTEATDQTPAGQTTEGAAAPGTGTGSNPTDQMSGLYTMALPVRDPFAEGTLPEDPSNPSAPVTQPTTTQQAPPSPVAPRGTGRRSYTRSGGGSIDGNLPPFNPLPDTQAGSIGGGVQVTDPNGNTVSPESPNGGYSVSGVIQGPRNSAVITNAGGHQQLVHEGQSLDQDTKVVSVKNGEVVISRKGKTSKLKMGGNP